MLVNAVVSFGFSYLAQPIWIESHNGRVSVVGKVDGRHFNVLVFDRSLLDKSKSLTGIDMSDGASSKGFTIDQGKSLALNLREQQWSAH